ncbi:MAG: hypothetical protein U1G08_08710 [Verrucomicrobiota bacterium]
MSAVVLRVRLPGDAKAVEMVYAHDRLLNEARPNEGWTYESG